MPDIDYNADASMHRHAHPRDGGDDLITRTPPRTLGGWITGAVGAVMGTIGADTYTRAKLYEFDGEVDNLVRNDIMNRRNGAGAGLESAASGLDHSGGLPLGGFGPGVASHSLREAHAFNLAQSGKYPFARFIKKFGSWPITFAAAAVTGLGAMAAYFALVPKKKEPSHPVVEEGTSGMDNKLKQDFIAFAKEYESAQGGIPEQRKEWAAQWETRAEEGRDKMREASGKDWKSCACSGKGERKLGE